MYQVINQALLCYHTCLSLLALLVSVQCFSDPCFIFQIPWFLRQYIFSVFHCANNLCGRVPVDYFWSVANDSARAMCGQGGVRRVHLGGKKIMRVCAQNYSGKQFIAPRCALIPGLSPDPDPIGYWGGFLHKHWLSTTLRPWLQSICSPNHIRLKWVPQVFLPWVDSNSWLRLDSPSWVCHQLRGQTEGKHFVVRGIYHHDYPSFSSPNDTEAYPWVCALRCLRQHLKV